MNKVVHLWLTSAAETRSLEKRAFKLVFLVMEQGIKKPPLNGGVSQAIPITRPFNKCSASRQVCAADPPDVVD